MPGKTYLNVLPFTLAWRVLEGPICALGEPASPTMGSHHERRQRQRILSSGGQGRPVRGRLEPGIWPSGYVVAAI